MALVATCYVAHVATSCGYNGYMGKERVVRLRVSGSEADRWVEAAYEGRVSLSEWLRQAANARVAGQVVRAVEEAAEVSVRPASRSVIGPGDMQPIVAKPEPASDPVTKAMRALDDLKPLAREIKPDPRKK